MKTRAIFIQTISMSMTVMFAASILTACSQTCSNGGAQTPQVQPIAQTETRTEPQTETRTKPQAEPQTEPRTEIMFNFDGDEVGKVPSGIRIAETAGAGTPAVWEVVKDGQTPSEPNAFGTTESKNHGHTFNLALIEGTGLGDVDMTVKVKAIGGKEDQGGGPVWRASNGDNYYIARWNPLEDNFRVYIVKKGRRRQLATVKVKLPPEEWHTIRILMRGSHIDAWLDGGHHLEVDDDTFAEAGMFGLWTKADAAALFDDLEVGSPKE